MRVLLVSGLSLAIGISGANASVAEKHSKSKFFEQGHSASSTKHPLLYPGTFESFQKIDFANFDFYEFDARGVAENPRHLQNGSFRKEDGSSWKESLKLDSVVLLPSTDENEEFALALYTEHLSGGGSSLTGIARVYEFRDHQLFLIEDFRCDEHFASSTSYVSFASTTNTLTMHNAHPLPGDAYCCISAMDIITLRWNGSIFEQMSDILALTERGIREGKKLKP